MTQLIPEKILEIIDDHDRAEKKQRNKIGFIYLCLCLAIIGVAAYSFMSWPPEIPDSRCILK
ncbi:hypothetical protein GS059_004512 [Salmonella enterica]|nr:hypothetical protein [Salmonella enterica]EFX0628767.1 hypothetical protein [Shigella sonnei]